MFFFLIFKKNGIITDISDLSHVPTNVFKTLTCPGFRLENTNAINVFAHLSERFQTIQLQFLLQVSPKEKHQHWEESGKSNQIIYSELITRLAVSPSRSVMPATKLAFSKDLFRTMLNMLGLAHTPRAEEIPPLKIISKPADNRWAQARCTLLCPTSMRHAAVTNYLEWLECLFL